MAPNQYQQALKTRGFTKRPDGSWHGPWGLVLPGTWNDITTTSLAEAARGEIIRQVDDTIKVRRQNFNAK